MDKGEVTALTLLDLSAALDTIDHATLTDRHFFRQNHTLLWSSIGLCARTSAFYFIHYTTQRYYL